MIIDKIMRVNYGGLFAIKTIIVFSSNYRTSIRPIRTIKLDTKQWANFWQKRILRISNIHHSYAFRSIQDSLTITNV